MQKGFLGFQAQGVTELKVWNLGLNSLYEAVSRGFIVFTKLWQNSFSWTKGLREEWGGLLSKKGYGKAEMQPSTLQTLTARIISEVPLQLKIQSYMQTAWHSRQILKGRSLNIISSTSATRNQMDTINFWTLFQKYYTGFIYIVKIFPDTFLSSKEKRL